VIRLGDLCKTAAGGTPLKSKKEFYEDGAIPWLVSGEVNNRNITSTKRFITQLGLDSSSAKVFPANTVVIAMYGATAGEVGILKFPTSTNQAVCGIYPNEKVLPEYLYYFFLSHKRALVAQAVGNAQPNISQQKIKDTYIELPPIPEQQRIVAILDQAFADIEKARANAERNLKNARELFDSYLNQVFSQRGEGWVEKPLGDVICKTHTKDPRKNPELKFLYVDVSSVSNTTLEITEATELLGKDAPSRARRVISEGNVIFATVRPTLKRIAIVPNRLDGEICSTGYFVFKTSDELNNRYLYYFLQSYCFMGEMEKLQSGASYPAVNDSQVKQTIIKYSSIIEQQSIVASLDKLSKQVQQLERGYQEKLTSLDELKKSLLQKAFSGELTKAEGYAA